THATGSFRGAQRELMALAGIADFHTLDRSLKRLTARGLVVKAGNDGTSGATLWRWGEAALTNAEHETAKTHANHSTGSFNREDSSAVDYALFAPAEHGIFETLCTAAKPLKPHELAQRTGLKVTQVKYALRTTGA